MTPNIVYFVFKVIQQLIMFPPKTSELTKPLSKPAKSQEKQMTLFGKVLQEPLEMKKSKGKQFKAGDEIVGKSSAHRWKLGTGQLPANIKISSWNVNGIRSVISKGDLGKYLKSVDPDILCINQTKIDEKAFDKEPLKIEGYNGYWNFCKISSGYSGVAVFSRVEPISVVEDLPEPNHSQQGRTLTLQFQKFYLVASYVPNSGTGLVRLDYRTKQYDVDMHNYLEFLRKKKPVIWSGDLNVVHQEIDIARPQENHKSPGFTLEERQSFSKLLQRGWVDTFRHLYPKLAKYSWWSMRTNGREKNIGWRLDYFVVSQELMSSVKDSTINNDIMGSDHCPIELTVQF